MKPVASLLLGCIVLACASGTPALAYDADLAARLGADEHGMKMYALVLLTSGPATDLPADQSERAFAGHMANINRMADAGKLVFAGPFARNERYRGIFVLDVQSRGEAEALVATDPAVQAGALAGEVYLLYGSAALQQVTAIHRTISKD